MKLNRERKLKRSEVRIVPLGTTSVKRSPKGTTHLVFQSVRDFRYALHHLPKHVTKMVNLVFDSPIAISKFTIPPADFFVPTEIHIFGLVNKPADLNFQTVNEIKRTHFCLIEESVKEVKAQATVLNQMMTFIYSLPRSTHQTAVKEAVCQWMLGKYPLNRIEALIARTPEAVLNTKQLARLRELLSSEVATLYRTALQEGGESSELARKYSVSAYEINYMRAVVAAM